MSLWKELSNEEILAYKKWAGENYHPGDTINPLWHPVIRAECAGMNQFMIDNYTPKMVTVETVQREAKAFMELVAEMRSAQQDARNDVLKLSRSLEKQVDKAIDKHFKNDNQQNLFK